MAEREDTATFERAKALFLEGVGHIESGDAAAAERCFESSLALIPGRASTLLNLGVARVQLGSVPKIHRQVFFRFQRRSPRAPASFMPR